MEVLQIGCLFLFLAGKFQFCVHHRFSEKLRFFLFMVWVWVLNFFLGDLENLWVTSNFSSPSRSHLFHLRIYPSSVQTCNKPSLLFAIALTNPSIFPLHCCYPLKRNLYLLLYLASIPQSTQRPPLPMLLGLKVLAPACISAPLFWPNPTPFCLHLIRSTSCMTHFIVQPFSFTVWHLHPKHLSICRCLHSLRVSFSIHA